MVNEKGRPVGTSRLEGNWIENCSKEVYEEESTSVARVEGQATLLNWVQKTSGKCIFGWAGT